MLKVNIIATIATLALLETANAKFSFGFCDQPTLQPDFDIQRYLGTWFEIQRDAGTTFQLGGDCTQARYALNPDGTVNVHNT